MRNPIPNGKNGKSNGATSGSMPRAFEILRLFEERGPLPQSHVGEILSIRPPSVHAHFQKLEQEGLIRELENRPVGGRGRPLKYWDIARDRNHTVVLCFIPPNLFMGMGDFNGHVLLQKQLDVGDAPNFGFLEELTGDFVDRSIKNLAKSGGQLRSIFVGMPGWHTLDNETGILTACANLPVLIGWDAESFLQQRFGVLCHSDTHFYAFYAGEAAHLDRSKTVAVMDWDLGIGLVTGQDNHLNSVPNFSGSAHKGILDFGHMSVEKTGRPCHCGKRGCLEAYAGGWAILDRLSDRHDIKTLEDVIRFGETGDEEVLQVLTESALILGEQLSWVIRFLGIEKLIFTGPFSPVFPTIRFALNEGLAKHLTDDRIQMLDISASADPIGRMLSGACHVGRRVFLDVEAYRARRGVAA